MRVRFFKLNNPFTLDLRALALLRIGLGALLLADLAIRAPDVAIWLSDNGVFPRSASIEFNSDWRWSLYWLNGESLWAGFLMAMAAGFATMLMFGVRTRSASIISFILLLSLHNRNPLLLQGGDNLLLLLLFWGCFLPWGERLSIDASMVREPRRDNRYLSVGSVALVLQVLSVYFFSALLKTGDEWVKDGTAIYYALHNEQVAFGLAQYWRDLHWLTQPLTQYVWWLELVGPLLALSPLFFVGFRTFAVLAFICLEIGFIFNLRIGLFPYVSILSLVAIMPTVVLDRLWPKQKANKAVIQMYFDKHCVFCEKTCYLLKYALGLPNATIQAAQDDAQIGPILERENSWVVIDEHGRQWLRWAALVYVIRCSRRFGWLGKLFERAGQRGDVAYNWIGDHRQQFGQLTAILMPWRQTYPRAGISMSLIAGALAVLVLWHNIASIDKWDRIHGMDTGLGPDLQVSPPSIADPLYSWLRLNQRWNMFAPWPQKNDGWLLMPGVLKGGDLVEIGFMAPHEFSFERPMLSGVQYQNYRWRKYLTRLQSKQNSKHRLMYGSWLCRTWNAEYQASEQLEAFNLYWVKEHTEPPGHQPEINVELLMEYHCRDAKLVDEKIVKEKLVEFVKASAEPKVYR